MRPATCGVRPASRLERAGGSGALIPRAGVFASSWTSRLAGSGQASDPPLRWLPNPNISISPGVPTDGLIAPAASPVELSSTPLAVYRRSSTSWRRTFFIIPSSESRLTFITPGANSTLPLPRMALFPERPTVPDDDAARLSAGFLPGGGVDDERVSAALVVACWRLSSVAQAAARAAMLASVAAACAKRLFASLILRSPSCRIRYRRSAMKTASRRRR